MKNLLSSMHDQFAIMKIRKVGFHGKLKMCQKNQDFFYKKNLLLTNH